MAKTKTKPEINFLENPDNVTIGDWVKDIHSNKVGRIDSRVETGPKMLNFWINFLDTTVGTALAKDLRKVEAPTSITKSIDLSLVIIDPDLQQRVKLDESIIEEYAIALSNGEVFPPITVWHNTEDGRNYLVDGFHRVAAAKKAGINELPFTIKQGEFREAILYSVSLNSTHGLRRSNEDKRKAVMTLLQDEEWSTWSNVAIANQCGVSESFVRKIKKESHFAQNEVTTYTNKYGVKTQMNTTNIGKKEINEAQNEVEESESHFAQNEVEKSESHFAQNEVKKPESHLSEDNPVEEIKEEDDDFFPEDVIKDLWDDEDEDDSVNEDSVSKDSVSNNKNKTENPNPTSTKPSKRRKRQKEKSRLVNPLSVGDRVKVKDNHYFGGKTGEVTQIANVNSVIVAFEDNHHQLLQLSDLDLPESLQKPQLQKPQRPKKKEIILKEGLNYFVKESEDKCRWYVELDKEIYEGLKIYQDRVQAMSVNAAMMRFLENEGILLRPYPDNQLIDEKPSAITNLTSDTRNKLENYISKHGESGIMKLLDTESS